MPEAMHYLKAFIALFILVNPLEAIPLFLARTSGEGVAIRSAIARRAYIAVCVILLVSAFLGNGMLRVFGVSIGAFQVGGGVILFMIALKMVFGSSGAAVKASDGDGGLAFAIVPLAIPLMAGPGAIAGAILYGTRAHSLAEMGILAGVIVGVSLATYASLRLAGDLAGRLKETGIAVATSVMGLIIAAIAVEMAAKGVAQLFGLGGLGGVSGIP